MQVGVDHASLALPEPHHLDLGIRGGGVGAMVTTKVCAEAGVCACTTFVAPSTLDLVAALATRRRCTTCYSGVDGL